MKTMAALCPPKPRLSEIAWVGLGIGVGVGVGLGVGLEPHRVQQRAARPVGHEELRLAAG